MDAIEGCLALEEALDSVCDRVIVLGPDRAIRFCNAAFATRLNLARETLVGMRIDALYGSRHLGPEVGARLNELLKRDGGRNQPMRTRDGRELRVSCRPQSGGGWTIVASDELACAGSPLARRRMAENLAEIIMTGRKVAVLYLDLDRFKAVNDTLGHEVGDRLLNVVVDRIQSALSPPERVLRLGGDEFGVVHTGDARSAADLADTLIDLVSRPTLVGGHVVQVGLSVGIALAPEDGIDPEGLLRSADRALYAAKAAGRGLHRRFEPLMDLAMAERRALEFELRKAEKLRQFRLHFQPQVDPATGRVLACEALLRWEHPARGMVPAGAFLRLAEEIGLMGAIGDWAIKAACREAVTWPEHVAVAVNVSPAQFVGRSVADAVRTALAETRLDPRRLELEITETLLLDDTEANLAHLNELRALGVRIAMDDFGTGYSALSYLARFPFDTVKVDRSFVARMGADPACAAIVRAVAELGGRLGMNTVAEGVETPEQLEAVRAHGFGAMQGFLFSRPLAASELADAFVRWGAADCEQALRGMSELFRLVYISRNAIEGPPEAVDAAVAELLAASRRRNAEAGMGGVLMFNNGGFVQVLEGPLAAVEATFERIQRDRRHDRVIVLEAGPAPARRFAGWAMAFVGASDADRMRYSGLQLDLGVVLRMRGDQLLGMLEALAAAEERRAAA